MTKELRNLNFLKEFLDEEVYLVPEVSEMEKEEEEEEDFPGMEVEKEPLATQKIMVIYESYGLLSPAEHELLKNILQAVQVKMTEVSLFPLEQVVDYNIPSETSAQQILFFGTTKLKGIELNWYEIIEINKRHILRSHPIHELMKDKTKKMRLWKALKEMFGV